MTRLRKPYSAATGAKKSAAEGGSAALIAAIIVGLFQRLREMFPELTLGPDGDAALVGLITGLVAAASKALRNWWKHR